MTEMTGMARMSVMIDDAGCKASRFYGLPFGQVVGSVY